MSVNGQVAGPYPEDVLRGHVVDGRVPFAAFMSCGGEWITARQFMGGYVPGPAPAGAARAATGPGPAPAPRAPAPHAAPAAVAGSPPAPVPAPAPAAIAGAGPAAVPTAVLISPVGVPAATPVPPVRAGPPPLPVGRPPAVVVPPVLPGAPIGPVAPVAPGAPVAPRAGGPPSNVSLIDELIPEVLPDDTAPARPGRAGAPAPDLDDGPLQRDRIVVLGRRQSGKTIYLATIYSRLWKSLNGMTAKALSGEVHKSLMNVVQMLKEGQWPPSTLGTSQIDLEIEYHGRKRLLVALDFAGELFSKAFLDEQSDWPGVRELVNHIDRAAAVILLVDPAVVAGMDHTAAMEDDFGVVQAVQRIRNWPGGEDVPIILVLTKMDLHQHLLDKHGGHLNFVRKHFPALVRQLKQIPIMQVSAVQVERDGEGKPRPRRDSATINIDNPLRYCLQQIDAAEHKAEVRQAEDQKRMMAARLRQEELRRRRREAVRTSIALAAITLVGVIVLGVILYFNL